ncbi:SMC family ATPase [uncultured Arthrobacter sp.]|uniref:AAA family ATPase n=1 Tax=uncultured Arthrobacter sp. TaxID=114050 RepID=UPI00262D933D|nr:SMC family ATPase [uncultured Arthrobacter sp.]
MRLHRLELQAFGPFADRQGVDFDALSSQGLFLLNGPTGAGKSSVLDAVCFALYGSVPGVRSAKRLRSDHAAESVAPEVSLEFSAGSRRFRVVRSPAWQRPARRGTGTTTEQARTLLSELVGSDWVQRSTRNDEAGLELHSVLGMDKEQFTKVVMLPQGEFAAFLRADATTRRELLQRLFSTTRFEVLERMFAEQSQRLGADVAGQEARLGQLFQRALDEAGRHGPGAAAVTADHAAEERAGIMRSLAADLSERRDGVAEEHRALAEQGRLADGALTSLRGRRRDHGALAALREQQSDHEGRAADVAAMTDAAARHDRAQSLAKGLRLDDEAAATLQLELEGQAAALDRVRSNPVVPEYLAVEPVLPGARGGADGVPDPADGIPGPAGGARGSADGVPGPAHGMLGRACAASSAALAVLRAALPDEQRLLGIRSEAGALTTTISGLDDAIRDATEALTRIQHQRAAGLEKLEPLRHAADGLTHLRTGLATATAAEQSVQDHRVAQARRAEADDRFRDASEHFLALKEQWLAALQLRLEQAADELAERLVDGEPCPVCGSPDHPAPVAPSGGDRMSLEEERSARRRQDEAEAALQSAREVRDRALLETAELSALVGGLSPEDAAEATTEARRRLQEAETARTECAAVEHEIDRLTREAEQRTLDREGLREERATADTRRSSLTDLAAELELRVAGLLGEAPTLARRIEDVQGAAEDLEALRRAGEAVARALADRTDTAEHLEQALRETRFDSAAEARAALLSADRRERMGQSIREHEIRGHRLDAAWDDDAIRTSLREEQDGSSAPTEEDERVAADHADALRVRAQRAGISAEVLTHSVAQLEAYTREFEELERIVEPLREQAALVAAVAETARGGGENLYRMPLATYVLASRLEQVAAAATERLLEMSDGRYQLVHSDARAGNRRSGLGLDVVDGWTGNRRDTSTLSGGESFMASLALALGLADVVQQEAGGLDIETLFIDEGFGSLDEQALEQVMDALEGLRSGGRVVGLVSHVPELKQRVNAQLQVVKERQGSQLRIVGQAAVV